MHRPSGNRCAILNFPTAKRAVVVRVQHAYVATTCKRNRSSTSDVRVCTINQAATVYISGTLAKNNYLDQKSSIDSILSVQRTIFGVFTHLQRPN